MILRKPVHNAARKVSTRNRTGWHDYEDAMPRPRLHAPFSLVCYQEWTTFPFMDRRSADPPASATDAPAVRPSEPHAELALREASVLMAPVARWLMRNGVTYPAFAAQLKAVFLAAAQDELVAGGTHPTHSALSVLSGVHRKDVRALLAEDRPETGVRRAPLASVLYTRWLSEPQYREKDGKPRALTRTGDGPRSFERLARETSSDVHPRTMLDELVRSGLVRVEGDEVVPQEGAFVPSRKLDELTALFSANVADHIAAGVHNLTTKSAKYLEQSVFADGLTEQSVDHLHQVARQAWATAFAAMVGEARQRVEADADADSDIRMRFGVYFYSEPVPGPQSAPAPSGAGGAPRNTRSRRT